MDVPAGGAASAAAACGKPPERRLPATEAETPEPGGPITVEPGAGGPRAAAAAAVEGREAAAAAAGGARGDARGDASGDSPRTAHLAPRAAAADDRGGAAAPAVVAAAAANALELLREGRAVDAAAVHHRRAESVPARAFAAVAALRGKRR